MSTPRDSFRTSWAIPIAIIIPVLACVFAFSLGPSPYKHVDDYARHAGPASKRLAALQAAGPDTWAALLETVKRPGLEHRAEALEFLADRNVVGARALFTRIAQNADEPMPLRRLARELLDRRPMAANAR